MRTKQQLWTNVPQICLLTFYTSSSWAQKLYTDWGKARRSFLCGVRVCDINHWTINLTGTSVCEYSNMAPFWMSLILDARPYGTLSYLVAWVELLCVLLVSFVAWVLHTSQSWRLKVPLPSRLVPSACHQLVTMHAHVLIFLCVWLIAKLVCVGSPSHSPPNTPLDGFITNLIILRLRICRALVFANVLKHPECSLYYLLVILVNTTLQPPVYWCSSCVVT